MHNHMSYLLYHLQELQSTVHHLCVYRVGIVIQTLCSLFYQTPFISELGSTEGHLETAPKATPALSWHCVSGRY